MHDIHQQTWAVAAAFLLRLEEVVMPEYKRNRASHRTVVGTHQHERTLGFVSQEENRIFLSHQVRDLISERADTSHAQCFPND